MLETNSLNSSTDEGSAEKRSFRMKIIAVGGAGANAINKLKLEGMEAIEVAAINTDAQALSTFTAAEGRMLIGRSVTRGLGSGGEVEIARAAAEADRALIGRLLEDQDLIILVAGLGGGTGSAVASIVAELAAKSDALVLAFVTLPFSFEGARRKDIAETALAELRMRVHGLITLPNDVLLQESEEDATVLNAFAVTDQWIGRGIASLATMLFRAGLINQDFGSLRSVFQGYGGKTIFGIGRASGEAYVERALEELFICPLLHLGDRPGKLDRILVNVVGGRDLGIAKVNQVMSAVAQHFGSRDDVVFGAVIDTEREEFLEICVMGKAEMERVPVRTSSETGAKTVPAKMVRIEGLGLETEITTENKPPQVVHASKLTKRQAAAVNQDEFTFIEVDAQRGYFEKTDRNLYEGEDLDVPTFLRKGIKIKIKV